MSCWYCIPSKRSPEEANSVIRLWKERGYKVAIFVDDCDFGDRIYDRVLRDPDGYPGYAKAVNALVNDVSYMDHSAEWFIAGGDDVEPDLNHSAEEIARECSEHFYNSVELQYPPDRPAWSSIPVPSAGGSGKNSPSWIRWATFGVMQPTGDRWGDSRGALIDRICGSPWMGREFCRRIYGGKGPLWPEFTHMFVDEHLQRVAQKLGILWQRPDLRHHHRHFMREPGTDKFASSFAIPEHLKSVCTGQHWNESLATFRRLEGNDFKEALDLLP